MLPAWPVLLSLVAPLFLEESRAQTGSLSSEPFDSDAGWESFRSRLKPSPAPVSRQDFGYRASNWAGGIQDGEIGGWIQRSVTPAWYAKRISPKTLDDPLKASGQFAVTKAEGGSGLLFGWFNQESRGWRTPNSLVFRLDGNGGKYWVFYEYGTRNWLTGGGGCFEGERYQTTPTKPFAADGTVHRWSMEYDPGGQGGRGLFIFQIDGTEYRLPLAPGHKEDGARFDRFGMMNVQIYGDGLDVYFDDVELDGEHIPFGSDPLWEGLNHSSRYAERAVRPFHDFGYSPTSQAGGQKGEIGGIIWRDEQPAYYALPVGPFSLEDELFVSGRIAFLAAGSDSGVYLGWFDSLSKRRKTTAEHEEPPQNILGILLEGPSRIGHYFRPVYRNRTGLGWLPDAGPILKPDGQVHRWSIHYLPKGGEGSGEIQVQLDGNTQTLRLEPDHRRQGAVFDRFGLFNLQAGGHFVEIYLDDLLFGKPNQ